MSYFICGSVFLLLGLVAKLVEYRAGINQKYEEAKKDAQTAIDNHDTTGLVSAQCRMRLYR